MILTENELAMERHVVDISQTVFSPSEQEPENKEQKLTRAIHRPSKFECKLDRLNADMLSCFGSN